MEIHSFSEKNDVISIQQSTPQFYFLSDLHFQVGVLILGFVE